MIRRRGMGVGLIREGGEGVVGEGRRGGSASDGRLIPSSHLFAVSTIDYSWVITALPISTMMHLLSICMPSINSILWRWGAGMVADFVGTGGLGIISSAIKIFYLVQMNLIILVLHLML